VGRHGVEREIAKEYFQRLTGQAPRLRYPRVDVDPQTLAFLVGKGPGLDAERSGEICIAIVNARQSAGRQSNGLEVVVTEIGNNQSVKDEEVKVKLDEPSSLPVEREAIHDAYRCRSAPIVALGEYEVRGRIG